MFNKGREFMFHMSHRHMVTSTGMSPPKVSSQCSGVFTVGGVPWASTVSSGKRIWISPTCLHREGSRTSREKNRNGVGTIFLPTPPKKV